MRQGRGRGPKGKLGMNNDIYIPLGADIDKKTFKMRTQNKKGLS